MAQNALPVHRSVGRGTLIWDLPNIAYRESTQGGLLHATVLLGFVRI